MSVRHHAAFEAIRREHDDVVAALKNALRSRQRGAPGDPAYDPQRLDAAIATAGDAYALLLIATAEGFLRQYLQSIGVDVGNEPKLSMLIDKSFKELNERSKGIQLRSEEKQEMHDLRAMRNHYAHGHGTGSFPPGLGSSTSRLPVSQPVPVGSESSRVCQSILCEEDRRTRIPAHSDALS